MPKKHKWVRVKGQSIAMQNRGVIFTTQEASMLKAVIMEYLQVFGEAEDTREYTNYMLKNGLGSAAKKIWKKDSDNPFRSFVTHRESYQTPSFEDWMKQVQPTDRQIARAKQIANDIGVDLKTIPFTREGYRHFISDYYDT